MIWQWWLNVFLTQYKLKFFPHSVYSINIKYPKLYHFCTTNQKITGLDIRHCKYSALSADLKSMQSCKFSTKANSFYLILEISRTTDLTMNAVSHSWQFRDPKFEFGCWTLSIWTCYLQKTKTLTCQIKTRSFTKNHRPHTDYNSFLSLYLLDILAIMKVYENANFIKQILAGFQTNELPLSFFIFLMIIVALCTRMQPPPKMCRHNILISHTSKCKRTLVSATIIICVDRHPK